MKESEGRREKEKETERENRKSLQKVCKGREKKSGLSRKTWKMKFSFKRSALTLKSQVEGFI